MTNSHLLGWITFGAFALFALLAQVVSYTHPDVVKDRAMQRYTRYTALFLLLFGAGFGYLAFAMDNGMRAVTLHEVMVEGNLQADRGSSSPTRTVSFVVEHPGVEHRLFLSPTSDLTHPPKADAKITFFLKGANGEIVLPEATERFAAREMTERERADWDGRTFPFTPTASGTHTLQLKPITARIPRIHVLITDPKKRDGKRMPGY